MSAQPPANWMIGLVGFSYPEWGGTLYARLGAGKPARDGGRRLAIYAEHFNAVEINTTFYGVPSRKTVRAWSDQTPEHFRFCVKMPRDVTHGPTPPGRMASSDGPPPGHLYDESTIAAAFRLLDALEPLLPDKLGAVLVQFPPKFGADRLEELASFLGRLGRAAPLAVELRGSDWPDAVTASMLRECGAAWVTGDESPRRSVETDPECKSSRNTPGPIAVTSDVLYLRWLGRHGQFTDRTHEHFDPTPRLRWWHERLRETLAAHPHVRTVYGFFDNDFAGHAPATARRFMGLAGIPGPLVPPRRQAGEQTLFG